MTPLGRAISAGRRRAAKRRRAELREEKRLQRNAEIEAFYAKPENRLRRTRRNRAEVAAARITAAGFRISSEDVT